MSVITGKARIPFNHLKSIYGDELNALKNSRSNQQIDSIEISHEERKLVKNRIREIVRAEQKKLILHLILTIILTTVVVIGLVLYLTEYFKNNS